MRKHWSWRSLSLIAGMLLLVAGMVAVRGARAADKDDDGGAWLGIYTQPLTSDLREGMEYQGKGVLVNRVVPNSPADKAGIGKGDIVLSVNMRSVESPEDLSDLVSAFKPGSNVSVTILRAGEKKSLQAKLGARTDADEESPRMSREDMPEMPDMPMPPGVPDRESIRRMVRNGMHGVTVMSRGRLGVRVQDLNSDLGEYFNTAKGALVTDVVDDTPARAAGIKSGDVITKVGDTTIENSSDLIDALRGRTGKVSIEVKRRGERRVLEADLGSSSMGDDNGDRVRVYRYHGPNGSHSWSWNDSGSGSGGDDDAALRREIQDLKDELRDLRKQIDESKAGSGKSSSGTKK